MADILILGGGFGGIRAALDLGKKLGKDHTVTLVDKNDCHLFLPSIYEVASAKRLEEKEGEDLYRVMLRGTVCIPYGKIFSGRNVNFVQAEVTHVDLRNKEVHLGSGNFLNYDYLIFAMGSEIETFGIPGVREYAFQFKTINDALFVHRRMHELYKEAMEGKKGLPIRFLIGGAGFTGIELAAELACCAEIVRKECNLEKGCTSISIFEATPRILPMISDKEREIIRKRLKKLEIKIYENSPIEKIEPNGVQVKNGEFIEGDIIIWTAGIRASSFISNIGGLHLDQKGKIKINEFLQAEDYTNIFAIGDNAVFIDPKTQKAIPGLAYVAIDQGKIAAENISRQIKNHPPKPYKPKYETWIAPVGGKYAVSHLNKYITVAGFWGWAVRVLVDLRYFMATLPAGEAIKLFFREMKLFTKND